MTKILEYIRKDDFFADCVISVVCWVGRSKEEKPEYLKKYEILTNFLAFNKGQGLLGRESIDVE